MTLTASIEGQEHGTVDVSGERSGALVIPLSASCLRDIPGASAEMSGEVDREG